MFTKAADLFFHTAFESRPFRLLMSCAKVQVNVYCKSSKGRCSPQLFFLVWPFCQTFKKL